MTRIANHASGHDEQAADKHGLARLPPAPAPLKIPAPVPASSSGRVGEHGGCRPAYVIAPPSGLLVEVAQ